MTILPIMQLTDRYISATRFTNIIRKEMKGVGVGLNLHQSYHPPGVIDTGTPPILGGENLNLDRQTGRPVNL